MYVYKNKIQHHLPVQSIWTAWDTFFRQPLGHKRSVFSLPAARNVQHHCRGSEHHHTGKSLLLNMHCIDILFNFLLTSFTYCVTLYTKLRNFMKMSSDAHNMPHQRENALSRESPSFYAYNWWHCLVWLMPTICSHLDISEKYIYCGKPWPIRVFPRCVRISRNRLYHQILY